VHPPRDQFVGETAARNTLLIAILPVSVAQYSFSAPLSDAQLARTAPCYCGCMHPDMQSLQCCLAHQRAGEATLATH
jgi:hypothetical protein